MPDWTAPFHLPHMTTAEFKKMKAKYIAKHGYTIYIPGFDDIVKIGFEKPITAEETREWRKKNWGYFTPERYQELKYMKKQRKERFLAMLGSPTPAMVSARASLLTAVDDLQDALSTLSALGIVAARSAPPQIKGVVTVGAGMVMTAARCMDILTEVMSPEKILLSKKRALDGSTEANPFTKKGQTNIKKQVWKAKIKRGTAFEALQVSEGIFGIGISLGAIMNAPIDIIAGNIRMVTGANVRVKYPIPDWRIWVKRAAKFAKSMTNAYALRFDCDDTEITSQLIAWNLAQQTLQDDVLSWNPVEMIEDIDQVEIRAPEPENILSIEAIEETGDKVEDGVRWVATGTEWATIDQLMEKTPEVASKNLNAFMKRNQNNDWSYIGGGNASDGALHFEQNIEGPDSITYDFAAWSKAVHRLLSTGYRMPQGTNPNRLKPMQAWLEEHEEQNTCPTTLEILAFAKDSCGFEFIYQP